MTLDHPTEETPTDPDPAALRVFSQRFAYGWIRRIADQWKAETPRGPQQAEDLPGDSLRE
jgi:hypothetical protein